MLYGYFNKGELIVNEFEDIHYEDKVITVAEQLEKCYLNENVRWKPIDDIDYNKMDNLDPYRTIVLKLYDNGDRLSYQYINELSTNAVKSDINKLKDELAASDYKIIKAYEASLTRSPVPYNLTNLHNERQALRDRINYLEKMI